ncbi:MAG TPA: heme-binding protein [Gammaproteobacteria bacterium]|nr:heme-binding protein [Gammaproteobacteria bacterium]
MQTRTRLFLALCASVAAASAMAQAQAPTAAPGAPPPAPPRARGPALALAVEAAQTAIAVCLANGYKTTATVVDSAGVPVAMLAADGAAERTQMIGLTKTSATIKYKVPSGEIADRVKTDAALDAEVKADAKIGTARRGALPIKVGGEIIGAMSVSGAPGGDKDEVCTQAGLDKIASRLK